MVKRVPSPHVYPLPNAPFGSFYAGLPQNSRIKEMVDEALDALMENRCAGTILQKKKIPKIYIQKYGIDNLYKMNLSGNHRLIYTLIALDEGVCPHIIEVMTHQEYNERFGYKRK